MADPRRITVTIDRLVLNGVAVGDRRLFASAMKKSLSSALETRGLHVSGVTDAAALTAPITVGGRSSAPALGRAVGRSVHYALAKHLGQGRSR